MSEIFQKVSLSVVVHAQHCVFPTNCIYLHVLKMLCHVILRRKNFMVNFEQGVLKYFQQIPKSF